MSNKAKQRVLSRKEQQAVCVGGKREAASREREREKKMKTLLIALKFSSFVFSVVSVVHRCTLSRATWMKLSLLFPIFMLFLLLLLLWNCRFTLNWFPTWKRSRL